MKLVPDTSVIIDGRVTGRIERGELDNAAVIVPEAVVAELESQANTGKEVGFLGLAELKRLAEFARQKRIKLIFAGERPSLEQIKLASGGEIDAMIRRVAIENGAAFMTSDGVQAEVARAKGIEVIYLPPEARAPENLKILQFFTPDTMSVHLKERVPPMAKRGSVGRMKFIQIRKEPSTVQELREIAHEIVEAAKQDPNGFIEIEKKGATVVQLGDLRVAIARPPFSDGLEITAVRPTAEVDLDAYRLSEELKERLAERQRGILIAGPPGAGKSTFAAAVAEFLTEVGYVVKTMETPRDLKVSERVTQYTALEGSMAQTADILLLVRPDYTIFDEMRKTRDFEVYADMRLAGVGMLGVVHATRPIDALQRLIGRIDLGLIPQVVDTIVFIDRGRVERVATLRFVVKVPHGMVEADLARPVIEVVDFETQDVDYEVYTYGEQVVVMAVETPKRKKVRVSREKIAKEVGKLVKEFRLDVSGDAAVVHVAEADAPFLLGKDGKVLARLEDKLGVPLDVRVMKRTRPRPEFAPDIEETDRHLVLRLDDHIGKQVGVYINGELLFNATVGRKGDIRITKDSPDIRRIRDALERKEPVLVRLATG
ncbi:MAG: PINc/VapC family ATPase [Halobacteria archaeon]